MREFIKKQKGFTIIEVVIVLAIAGLIFGVVFLAVPGFQRNQRDEARHNDVGRFIAEAKNSSTNNKQRLPGETGGETIDEFVKNYLEKGGSKFEDPFTRNKYTVKKITTKSTPENLGDFYYGLAFHCGTNGELVPNSAGNINAEDAAFAASIRTENGTAYCQNG